MKEIQVKFQINGKTYLLFIEKNFRSCKAYLFQQVEGKLMESEKIQKVSTSTIKDMLEYWWILLNLKLRKKLKKKSGESRRSRIGKCSRRNVN